MHALRLILNEVSLKGVKVILTPPRPLRGLPYWNLGGVDVGIDVKQLVNVVVNALTRCVT